MGGVQRLACALKGPEVVGSMRQGGNLFGNSLRHVGRLWSALGGAAQLLEIIGNG